MSACRRSTGDGDAGGHRVDVLIDLDDAERGRLLGGVFRADSRSVMFRFAEAGAGGDGVMYGTIIESVDEMPEGLVRARLQFWSDRAPSHVVPGARFEFWYVRTSGTGVVLPLEGSRPYEPR